MKPIKALICLLSTVLTVTSCGSQKETQQKETFWGQNQAKLNTRNKASNTCAQRIIFLPQTHPSILGEQLSIAAQDYERTARSQFSIAKFLEKNPGIPVFSEQVSTDQKVETVSQEFKDTAAVIKTMFPEGLPQTYEALSDEQRDVIARAGGDSISFILRNTDMLHRVVENDKIQDDLINRVKDWAQNYPTAYGYSPEIYNIIFNVRERLALDQINKYFKNNPQQRDVILIYGSDHTYSFRSHNDKFKADCFTIPEEFIPAVTTPYPKLF